MRPSTTLISALALIGSAVGRPAPSPTPQLTTCTPDLYPVSPQQQRAIFNEFVNLMYHNATVESLTKAWKHIAADEIQHNPILLDGAAASFAIVDAIFTNASNTVEIINQAFEAPVGWVHYRIDGLNPQPTAIADMYRFNGSCIVEHWDVIEERPVNATNSHALF